MNRATAHSKMTHKYSVADMEHTPMGSRVVCEDKTLLFEEAPEAYKCIEEVIEELQAAGLLTVVCVLRPIITYKNKQ